MKKLRPTIASLWVAVLPWWFPSLSAGELKVLEGHKRNVRCVAFSPDSKSVASGSEDGTIRVWDFPTEKQLFSLDVKPAVPLNLAFLLDGQTLVVSTMGGDRGYSGGALTWWDLKRRKVLRRIAFAHCTFMVASPDGKTIATRGEKEKDRRLKIWDAETGKELLSLLSPEYPYTVAYSPDGKLLAATGRTGDPFAPPLSRYDLRRQERVERTRMWDLQTQKTKWTYSLSSASFALAFSPDGKTLAVGHSEGGRGTTIIDVSGGKLSKYLRDGCREAYGMRYSSDGKWLLWVYNGVISVYEAGTGTFSRFLYLSASHHFGCLATSKDGKWLVAAGGKDTDIIVHDLSCLGRLPSRP